MHRQTRIRPRAVVWGLVVAACLIIPMAVSQAGAQQSSTTPNPEPLWKAYPLDDSASAAAGQSGATTSTPTQPAASPVRASAPTPLSATDEAGDGPPWALMVAAAAGGALFVVLLLTVQGWRARRRRQEPLVGAAEEWPWLTSRTTDDAREFRVERLRSAAGEDDDERREDGAGGCAVGRARGVGGCGIA